MHEVVKRQLVLETDLAEAFTNEEFFLVYQPIVDLETGLPTDVEALLRWRHPSRGVIGPVEFIPVLESSDLIIEVGRFVLMEACRQARTWHDMGHPVGISVNVAARQLHYDVLIDHVREALEAASLDPGYLTLEVTESMLMVDPKVTAQTPLGPFRPRRAHRHRRLRDRVRLALLPAGVPGGHIEDRPVLRRPPGHLDRHQLPRRPDPPGQVARP